MTGGLETLIGRLAGRVVARAGGHLVVARQRRQLADRARTLVPDAVAARTLAELDGERTAQLAGFVESPNFEELALHVVLASDRLDDEARAVIRAELRQNLRHAVDLDAETLFGITDVLLDALIAACRAATGPPPTASGAVQDPVDIAVRSHVVAAAARNGRLLEALRQTAEIHEVGEVLRAQVRALRAQIRLPHAGLHRAVDWADLYISPVLTLPQITAEAGTAATVEPALLLDPGRRSVVLGAPGAGKSTLAAKLAFDVASGPHQRVPFILVVREVGEELRRGGRTLVDHLASAARSPFGVEFPAGGIEYLLLNGRAVVFVDGLDEIVDSAVRQRLVDLVEGFAELYPLARSW